MKTATRRTLFKSLLLALGAFLLTIPALAKKDKGRIDWDKGSIYATGLGAMSNKEGNDAKAYLRARSFARMDARRNLLAVISHVKIDSRTTGQDYEASSDLIREEISGLVKGSEIIGERKIRMGNSWMVEVTVSMPIYGEDGVASVFVPEALRREKARRSKIEEDEPEVRNQAPAPIERRDEDTDERRPARPEEEESPAPRPIEVEPAPLRREPSPEPVLSTQPLPGKTGYYSSVIIDMRGLGMERCMAPRIRTRNGDSIWSGGSKVDEDYVITHGIASYVHSMDEAKRNARAGKNPLVLRGSPCAGNKFNTDAGLSEGNADLLREADRSSRFLDKCRVIFIVDQGK
jgi:hypothetical protein